MASVFDSSFILGENNKKQKRAPDPRWNRRARKETQAGRRKGLRLRRGEQGFVGGDFGVAHAQVESEWGEGDVDFHPPSWAAHGVVSARFIGIAQQQGWAHEFSERLDPVPLDPVGCPVGHVCFVEDGPDGLI